MKIDILTLFPEMYTSFFTTSIIKRAISKEVISIASHDIRAFTKDKNNRVDDYTCGGGSGLIMKVQPVLDCLNSVKTPNTTVILLTPKGRVYNQKIARELSQKEHIVLVCGHYEGIDERFNKHVDMMLSIGDYILTGGELASMVIADSLIRLQEGAINENSHLDESFENGLLEYPQYTLPREYDGEKIPDVLFSGNHKAIAKWRLKQSLKLTLTNRPDLLENRKYSKEELKLKDEIEKNIEEPKWLVNAINDAKKFMK